MKFEIKLGRIEIAGVELNNVELTSEYTTKEFIDLMYAGKKFAQEIIKESPEILMSLENTYNKFNEINERVEQQEPEMPVELQELIKRFVLNPKHI